MDELREALEGIDDTYDDFVRGILDSAEDDKEKQQKLLDFIKSDSDVTTSKVISYLDELEGIK